MVAVWAVGAFAALVAAYGPFWRDVGYWMERAMAHAEVQEWQAALVNVGRALDGAPADPSILTFAGHVHRELEQWPEAAGRFEQALEVDAGRPEAALGLAEVRLALDDADAAARALSSMRMADADPAQRARAIALAEEAGRPALALDLLEATHGSGPDADPDLDTRRTRARLAQAAGREQEALDSYDALHRDRALDAEGALAYAWMLNERGAHDEALEVLERAPVSADTRELAVRTALWADELEAARAQLQALPAGSGAVEELSVLVADAETRRIRAAREAAARAEAEAEAARLRDTPPADPAGALAFWRARLAADPSDEGARAEVVALLEAGERFEEALGALLGGDAIDEVATEGGPRAVHAARLSLWAGRPDDAVRLLDPAEGAAGGRVGGVAGGRADGPAAGPTGGPAGLLARARFEAGDAEGAYRTLAAARTGGDPTPSEASELLLTARVADATGRPSEAAEALGALSRLRPLDVEERRWWAGLLWRSGGLEGALAGYEGVRDLTPEDPAVHRSIGDLRMALGDAQGAESAYREAVRLGGPADPAGPGVALALLQQDRAADAVEAYQAYLTAAPGDDEARLALARALAGTGAFGEAAVQYERAVGSATEADPGLAAEVASAWMAAGKHAQAEPWARRAAADPDEPLARARYAHLLALLDRHAEAEAAIEALEREAHADASSLEGALVEAWIHRLRGRTLAALRALDGRLASPRRLNEQTAAGEQALSGEDPRLAIEARIFRAEVLEARGDAARAREAVADAHRAGAADTDVQHVDRALEHGARPRAEVGITGGSDARDLDVTTVWAGAALRPASFGAPAISAEVRHRSASQLGATGDGTAFVLGADSLFVSPALWLDGRLGLEAAEGGGTRVLGGLGATWETLGAVRWSLDVSRVPVWSEAERRGAPEYARVSNLGALDPDLMVSEVRAAASSTPRSPVDRSVHAEIGLARYSDGNDRAFGYAQWRLPLHERADASFALTPNVYAEGYRTARPSYASPSSFVALGLAAEASRTFGSVTLDGRANPHGYRLPGDSGLGIEGRLGLTLGTALGDLRLEGRYLKQGRVYDLFRIGTELSLPLGRAPR